MSKVIFECLLSIRSRNKLFYLSNPKQTELILPMNVNMVSKSRISTNSAVRIIDIIMLFILKFDLGGYGQVLYAVTNQVTYHESYNLLLI